VKPYTLILHLNMKTSEQLKDIIEKARQVGDTKIGKDGKTRVWSKTPSGFDWRRVKGSSKETSTSKEPKKKPLPKSGKPQGATKKTTKVDNNTLKLKVGDKVEVDGKAIGIVTKLPSKTTDQYSVKYDSGDEYGIMPSRMKKFTERNKEYYDKRISDLFEELVPGQGNADTLEGEMVRAVNRIGYRWFNDGDKYHTGYGTETAGNAHAFLMEETPKEVSEKLGKIFKESWSDEDYEKEIEQAIKVVVDHVDSKDGKYTESKLDMFDTESYYQDEEEDEMDDDYYDEEEDEDGYYDENGNYIDY